jgi:transcription termination/antitermination protein NusA
MLESYSVRGVAIVVFGEKWVVPTFLAYKHLRWPRFSDTGDRGSMKNEFVLAFNEVLEEKQLPKDVVLEALEAAMVSAYRRAVNASTAQEIKAIVDPETGKVSIYAEKEVVDAVQDSRTEVSLMEARQVESEAEIGEMVVVESTPKDFGRVAAQTARQVIQQRIREAERDTQMTHYTKQLGEIVNGVVQAVNSQGVTLGLDMKAEGVMPRNQMIPGERFRVHDRVRALLLEVKQTPRGPQIILSRAHRNFLRRLLENEVPEIYHGLVEIRSISREPGQRSKVAVAALQAGVDPVGACVGIRGVRIQAIVRELNDEKIDVIEWNADPAGYIAKALSPARVSGVYLNEMARGAKTATVVVPEDQLSLAIGRDGQNARLAAKLTSWRIDIKSLPEASTDALYKLQNVAEYGFLAQEEKDVMPQVEVILAKKAEGRAVTPEEYQVLAHFVDRVEKGLLRRRQAEFKEKEEREKAARAAVPPAAFEIPLEELNISERVHNLLAEAGYQSAGDLIYQMDTDQDAILGLSGVGPRAMQEIENALSALVLVEEKVEVPEGIEEVEAVEEGEPAEPATAEEPAAEMEVEAEAPEAIPGEEFEPEAVVEAIESVEEIPAAEVEVEAEAPSAEEEQVVEEEEEELPSTLDEIFALKPEVLDMVEPVDEEDEEEVDEKGKRKKKKRKKKFVEMEYDPEKDVVVVKKKRKRGGEWDDEWEI